MTFAEALTHRPSWMSRRPGTGRRQPRCRHRSQKTGIPMSSRKTPNVENLAALGATRLAELLIDISVGNAAIKRRLRMELAAALSTGELAKEVRRRLATIRRSRSFVDWQNIGTLAGDLDIQRRAIVETIAKSDAMEAAELLWSFMALAPSIYERCDDSSGDVGRVFHDACHDLGDVAQKARVDTKALADQAFTALCADDYGQFDNLVAVLVPALEQEGLEHLKQHMIDLSNQPVEKPADKDRVEIAWSSSSGPIYEDVLAESSRVRIVQKTLKEIADAQGDVDAFIAQHDEQTRKAPRVAAEIAQRLLAAGRTEDAWETIRATEHGSLGHWERPGFEWENARIDVLGALGREDDAQAARWLGFERALSATHLRAYLKRLPDFDDVVAEEKALNHVQQAANVHEALSFLVSWPDLQRAADLVIRRHDEIDGNHYELLTSAANTLAGKYPLAATLMLRAMIDFTLTDARSTRYKHAANHLRECSGLSSLIDDFGSIEPHDAYEARLRGQHGKKSSFWKRVD